MERAVQESQAERRRAESAPTAPALASTSRGRTRHEGQLVGIDQLAGLDGDLARLPNPTAEPGHAAAPSFLAAASTRVQRRADAATPTYAATDSADRIRRGAALPDGLRAGIEHLSGVSMDGVRVHYGSAEPRRLGAVAFAQGTDIHVAPGQERHLPHEAWHVVQQAQGRVAPMRQLKALTSVNEDQSLEHEATVMGERAVRAGTRTGRATPGAELVAPRHGDAPVQLQREDEFREDPTAFLANNVLSLTMLQGLTARSSDQALTCYYDPLLRSLGRLRRHWFKLVVDPQRDKPAQRAYILTPAIEQYVAAYPDDDIFAGLRDQIGAILPIEDDANYLSSAYIDYQNIGVTDDHEGTIGHTEIVKARDDEGGDFNPDLVFTAAMNGCALAITPSAADEKFIAWHFQSTTANRAQAAAFRAQRDPTDWFGEDEYDDNQHAGLFEATNFLHRDQDGSWNVVSQQNETSATNQHDVTIKKVDARALHLDEPARAAIVKRIYASLQATKNRDVRRYATNAAQYERYVGLEAKASLMTLKIDVLTLLDGEEALLRAADSMEDLLRAALAIHNARNLNTPLLTVATAALANHFEQRLDEENAKWKIMQDRDTLSRLPLAVGNLHDVSTFYGRYDWLTALIAEATPAQDG